MAWTEFFCRHIHFFFKCILKFGFLQNILRDFQKKSQYGNLPFSRQFFYQIQLDMAKKKCVLTNSMAK